MNDLLVTIGSWLGAGGVGALLAGWWKIKKDQRSDAEGSARSRVQINNSDAQINMLSDYRRRAKEAEEEADKEREARLLAQRAQITAEGLQHDAERDLRAARRDIAMLRKKLAKAGVPDSDYVPLLETQIGDLPEH